MIRYIRLLNKNKSGDITLKWHIKKSAINSEVESKRIKSKSPKDHLLPMIWIGFKIYQKKPNIILVRALILGKNLLINRIKIFVMIKINHKRKRKKRKRKKINKKSNPQNLIKTLIITVSPHSIKIKKIFNL